MVVACFLLVEVSICGGMLTMADSSWGKNVITPKTNYFAHNVGRLKRIDFNFRNVQIIT
jgi:cytochrome b